MAQSPHEEQQRREHEQRQAAKTKAPAPDPKLEERDREARAAASIGAQVILDFNEPAALGARGGAAGDIVGNQMVRDKYLVDLGLDPVSPSGPLPTPEQIRMKREREEFLAKQAAEGPLGSPRATRASSLAADLGDDAKPKGDNKKAA